MKFTTLSIVIAHFFTILFLYTGIAKLMEIPTFKEQLASSPFMSVFAGYIAWALPVAEILLAIALFIPKTRLVALYVTAALMLFFTGYILALLYTDSQLTCSCGGVIEGLTPNQHILFNGICVILALIGAVSLPKKEIYLRHKWITSSSTLALFAIAVWLLISAFRTPGVIMTGREGRIIPSIPLQSTDSITWIKTDDIPGGRPFLVLGFSCFCVHCQALTMEIEKNINDFKGTHIYYVTPDRFVDMHAFYSFYNLSKYSNITMGRDSANQLFRYFKTSRTPLVAIYGADRKLKKVVPGRATASQIAQMLEE